MRTKTLLYRFCKVGLLGAALMIPVSTTALMWGNDVQVKVYHDSKYNQDHEWNANEDRSYRVWVKERHRKYVDFGKLKEEDRQAYWEWRHDHPDSDHH